MKIYFMPEDGGKRQTAGSGDDGGRAYDRPGGESRVVSPFLASTTTEAANLSGKPMNFVSDPTESAPIDAVADYPTARRAVGAAFDRRLRRRHLDLAAKRQPAVKRSPAAGRERRKRRFSSSSD